ncbi:MAG TPA: PqqD family protein [Acidimicrobiales bacterium]|nr:PqqD family protein [Acidimicrobiales bacterium]
MRPGDVNPVLVADAPDVGFVPEALSHASTLEVDGRTVIYDERAHCMLVLNSSAGELWRRCDGTHTVDSIADALALSHDIGRDLVLGDVWSTVCKLAELGLVADARAHTPAA